ncbi:aldo/keto reductase [Halobaculum sp. MBLA0143]|uniref:aldo/keto reductase n=1 Tax=Halobaculum sp. MBLA0143 TaxID=3079933 RepID=UPI003526BC62
MDLPPVGFGTMGVDDPAAVTDALAAGYRHLDTAQIYDNEAAVGKGLAAAAVPREAVTLATKLWVDGLAADDVRASTAGSLDRLDVDRVDLLYVHRPRGGYDSAETLPALARVREAGLTDAVAVSNFEPDQLAAAHDYVDVAAHQVEFHPYYREPGALADAHEHGYPLVAYAPLAGGRVLDDPVIREVAGELDASPAATALAWVVSHDGVVAIPKASSPAHRRVNLVAADLSLSAEQRRRIDEIDRETELFPE